MGKNNKNPTLSIKYKSSLGPRTHLVIGSRKRLRTNGGRILKVRKLSNEQRNKTGEYNPLPTQLMREFKLKERLEGGKG